MRGKEMFFRSQQILDKNKGFKNNILAQIKARDQPFKLLHFQREYSQTSQPKLFEHHAQNYVDNADKPISNKQQALQLRSRINLAMVLMDQNQDLVNKIREIKKIIDEEALKTKIIKKRIEQQKQIILQLNVKKQSQNYQTKRLATLNQSAIPNKSVQILASTNTTDWVNQFLNKDQFDNLWQNKRTEKPKDKLPKTKNYLIDLTSFMATARKKPEKSIQKATQSTNKSKPQQLRKTLNVQVNLNQKANVVVELAQKQKQLNKNLAQMRNIKKIKINPEY